MKSFALVLVAVLMSVEASAAVKTETIDYKQGDTVLSGVLAYDDAIQGKRPGIVVVHEWWGRNAYVQRRAEKLAQLGYVAFAIDMYGKGQATTDPKVAGEWAGAVKKDRTLGRERFDAGLKVLKEFRLTDPARVAAIGYCFGGTVVLEMARGGADLAGVVSFHGGLDTTAPAEPGKVKARVLALAGGDDPFVPPAQVNAFEDEMRKAGADWQLVSYGGAMHSFTNPDADGYHLKGAAYNEKADRRSWEAMQVFFKEIFK